MIKKFNNFNKIEKGLILSEERTYPLPPKEREMFIPTNDELSQDEKEWIKSILDSYNNEYGFEPSDLELMESIFKKLNI